MTAPPAPLRIKRLALTDHRESSPKHHTCRRLTIRCGEANVPWKNCNPGS